MAIVRGSVTVADDETASGSGYALELYNEIKSVELTNSPLPSLSKPPEWDGTPLAWEQQIKPLRLRILRGFAREATRHSILVTYLLNNAQLQVKNSDAGLQRDNTGGNPATLAPSATKTFGNLL